MTTAARVFFGLINSLEENVARGILRHAQITQDNSRPDDGIVFVFLLTYADTTQTSHSFVFFDNEEGYSALSAVLASPFFVRNR